MSILKEGSLWREECRRRYLVNQKLAEKNWSVLEHAIHEIYNHNTSGLSFEDLYKSAYNMVLYKHGEKLYSGLVTAMTFHLSEISRAIEAAREENFLEELNRNWADYETALQMIQGILSYMDRNFITRTHKTPVYELGLNLWRQVVILSSRTQVRLPHTLLVLMCRERNGEVINRGLMSNIIKMLVDLGLSVYWDWEDFKKHFLEVLANFYRLESQKLIESCDCGDYLKKVERRRNEEIDRGSQYRYPISLADITDVMEKEMIGSRIHALVHMDNSGLVNMLVCDKYEDLKRMYDLFYIVPSGLTNIKEVMISYVRDTGEQLVSDPERLKDPVDMVQCLLDLKDKYDKIISLSFSDDETFKNALNSSFGFFINLNAWSPEFISLFVDDKLCRGLKGAGEEDVEIVLGKVMMLFCYLQQKDVFEKYYKQHLAKRLLSGKTISDDAERSLIAKLKGECGYPFTYKLERMFADMKISQDTLQGFNASHGADIGDGAMLIVQVLTTGSWPIQRCPQCNLPAEILGVCEKFRSYYLGTHSGRRLSWQTNMGRADLIARFAKGQKHELNVSTYQMCVLMLFNNSDQLTCKEIEQATRIPIPDLKRCLQSLACIKGKNVLRKKPMRKDIAEDDAFFFNDKFTSKFFEVRIGTVVAPRETEPENQETWRRVEEDRKPQIDAAIVRIMKSRRTLDHHNIVAEVKKQLQSRFLPDLDVINKQIESLIEREYLERDKVDRKLYHYLA